MCITAKATGVLTSRVSIGNYQTTCTHPHNLQTKQHMQTTHLPQQLNTDSTYHHLWLLYIYIYVEFAVAKLFNAAEAEKEEGNEFLVSEKEKNYTFLNKSCNLHAGIFFFFFVILQSTWIHIYIYTQVITNCC